MGIVDWRDVVGSEVLVCQTRMSCGLLSGVLVSTESRTKVLEEIPFFLRFRVLRVSLAPRFDMMEVGRECVFVTSASPLASLRLPPQELAGHSGVGGFVGWRVVCVIRVLAKDAAINNHTK